MRLTSEASARKLQVHHVLRFTENNRDAFAANQHSMQGMRQAFHSQHQEHLIEKVVESKQRLVSP